MKDRTPSPFPQGLCRPARLLYLIGAILAIGGCQERIEPSGRVGIATPVVAHPLVERDLPEIGRTGILRLIIRYNSSSYFIHRGGQAGFDYELVERFAREHGLTVGVVIPARGEDMISLLNSGKGDIVCTGHPADPALERWAAATRPTNFVQKVLVLPADADYGPNLEDLAGLTVTLPYGDAFRGELQRLRDESRGAFIIGSGLPLADPEELVARVATGELDAVVVDDLVARATLAYQPGLRLGAVLGERQPTVWLVRQNSPALKNALNAFLREQVQVDASGRTRRSQTYGIIHDRYFENPLTIRDFRAAAHRPDKSGVISEYDDLIRRRAEAYGLDWRVVAAQIYQESRFNPFARSPADARGLMQVLPTFAGEQADSLYVPEANLTAGLRLLRRTYDAYAYLDSLERWRFTLAEYHAGHGHLTDARRIAMEAGRNPNRWEDSVAFALPKLMERKYFENTRYGFYGGQRTVNYVVQIMNRARMYARLVPREAPGPVAARDDRAEQAAAKLLQELEPPPEPR